MSRGSQLAAGSRVSPGVSTSEEAHLQEMLVTVSSKQRGMPAVQPPLPSLHTNSSPNLGPCARAGTSPSRPATYVTFGQERTLCE